MRRLAVFLLGLLLILSGCSSNSTLPISKPSDTAKQEEQKNPIPQNSVVPQKKNIKVTLYFPDSEAQYLVKVQREVTIVDGAIVKAVIAELQKGKPVKVIPDGAKLLRAWVKNGIVHLDFSKEFQTNHWGGTTGESITIFSIVNSLTEIPNITAVQFYLEGKIVDSILGHADTRQPIKRNLGLIKP